MKLNFIIGLVIAFFVLAVSVVSASPAIREMTFILKEDKAEIYLVNKTTTILGFSYVDQFKDLIDVQLEPHKSVTIFTEENIKLVQSNQCQTEYYLKKGDSVTVALSKSGNAILSISNNLIRNNEHIWPLFGQWPMLDLQRQVFTQLIKLIKNSLFTICPYWPGLPSQVPSQMTRL